MSKKIWYSKPLAHQWDIYSKNYNQNKETKEQFVQRILLNYSASTSFSWTKNQLNTFIWSLWYSDATKKLLHLYFVDKSLKEFLETIPLADIEGISKYINENGFITEQGLLNLKFFPFGIHIPYENKYKAFAFGLMNNQDNQMVLSWAVEKGGAWCSTKNYKELLTKDSEEAKEITKIFRLAINTIAYMETFPECVKDGVPELIKEQENENAITIGISEKALEPIQNINKKMKTPHFRRGYFKQLSSPFYTKKRGQIIFVSETMVNGKAKTIYTTENIDDIKALEHL